MFSALRNIVITGAAGSLGAVLLEKLVSSGRFNVRVLRRNGSGSTFAPGIDVVDVDFESFDSLKDALAGQDAVVAPLGAPAIGVQKLLIDAAIAAGVRRFLPSEFGCDLANPNTRKLPVFAGKVKISDYLVEKSQTTSLTYTLVRNGAFLDWGLRNQFIFKSSDYKPTIYNGGNLPFSTTTLATVGDAVVAILSLPEETKNRAVYIQDLKLTQNKLLALAKQIAPDKPWQPEQATLEAVTKRSDERLANGLLDHETFIPYLHQGVLGPAYGGSYQTLDNELLGLKGKTEEDVIEILKQVLN